MACYSPKLILYFMTLVSLVASNLACTPSNDGDGFSFDFTDPYYSGAVWEPSEVSLTCSESSCPRAVGTLMMAKRSYYGSTSWEISRCTAFLTSKDEISTNGHCDKFDSTDVQYFITVATQGYSSVTRKVVSRIEKQYTKLGEGKSSFSKDYARLKLESPINNIVPIKLSGSKYILPSTRNSSRAELESFVVNSSTYSNFALNLDLVKCYMDMDTWHFPLKFSEKPDVFNFYGCKVIPGNSGSPMFSVGDRSTSVAVVQATAYKKATSFKLKSILNGAGNIYNTAVSEVEADVPLGDQYGVATSTFCLSNKRGCKVLDDDKIFVFRTIKMVRIIYDQTIELLRENFDRYYYRPSKAVAFAPVSVTFQSEVGINLNFVEKEEEVYYLPVPQCIKDLSLMNGLRELEVVPMQVKVLEMEVPRRLVYKMVEGSIKKIKFIKRGEKFYFEAPRGHSLKTGADKVNEFEFLTEKGIDLSEMPLCGENLATSTLDELRAEFDKTIKELIKESSKLLKKHKKP